MLLFTIFEWKQWRFEKKIDFRVNSGYEFLNESNFFFLQNDANSLDDDGGGGFFWDPPPAKNRDATKNLEGMAVIQEELSQATLRIRQLEDELKFLRANSSERIDEINDTLRKDELSRAKQDMVNLIAHIGQNVRLNQLTKHFFPNVTIFHFIFSFFS